MTECGGRNSHLTLDMFLQILASQFISLNNIEGSISQSHDSSLGDTVDAIGIAVVLPWVLKYVLRMQLHNKCYN